MGLIGCVVGARAAARALAMMVLAATIGMSLAAGASASARSCDVPGSKTLHVVGRVRIYTFDNGLYACSTRYGKRVLLYKSRKVKRVGTVLGKYAQFDQTVLAYFLSPPALANNAEAKLVSRNLKTGVQLRQYLDTSCSGNSCDPHVYELVTDAKGSFAWLEADDGPGSIYEFDVNEDDTAGFMKLDYAQEGAYCDGAPPSYEPCNERIDAKYLRAAAGMVYWNGGSNGTTLESASFN